MHGIPPDCAISAHSFHFSMCGEESASAWHTTSPAIERTEGRKSVMIRSGKGVGLERTSNVNLYLACNDETILRVRPLTIKILEFCERGIVKRGHSKSLLHGTLN